MYQKISSNENSLFLYWLTARLNNDNEKTTYKKTTKALDIGRIDFPK